MSLEAHFNRKKQRFTAFFREFAATIEKLALAVQLEIDREYDVASSALKQSSPAAIENECRRMEQKEASTLMRILHEICSSVEFSIRNPVQLPSQPVGVPTPAKVYETPSKENRRSKTVENEKLIKYQTAPKGRLANGRSEKENPRLSLSSAKPLNLEVCENLDRRIEHEALECLERSEKRKKYLESRKKLSRNIVSLEDSSVSYGEKLNALLNGKK